jgi:putative FmdB family regulatory protein
MLHSHDETASERRAGPGALPERPDLMPTYQYACSKCDEEFEVYQSFSDAPLKKHPGCGGKVQKVFSPVGIVLKGSGFYKTDNRSGGGRGKSDSGDKGGEKSSEKTGTTSESGTKTETKSDTSSSNGAKKNGAKSDSKSAKKSA